MKTKNIFYFLVSNFLKIFVFFIFLFARTFTGLEIYNFRLGELIVGFCLLLFLYYVIFKTSIKKQYFLNDKKINLVLIFLLFIFIFQNINYGQSFSNNFIFKTSTFIWSIGGLAIGYYLLKIVNFKIYDYDIYLSLVGLIFIYIYNTHGISDNRQDFLLNYTDKFEYSKGSDLLLALIFVFYLILCKFEFSNKSFILIATTTSLFLPLLTYKSRSGSLSLGIFLFFLFLEMRKKINFKSKTTIYTLVVSIILFIFSSSWVVNQDIVIDEEIGFELKYALTHRYSSINDNVYEKEVLKLKLFYIDQNRLKTTDGNLNWRLQIWQDVIVDMFTDKYYLFGYGYHDIIPAMFSDQRMGFDMTNINVHNYIIHILSRGGIVTLLLIWRFYLLLYKKFKKNNLVLDFNLIFYPLIFNSLFDPSMENPHYPTIFFILLGLSFNKSIIFKESKSI